MPMTSRQRILTALQGQTPDRVPCYPMLTRYVRYHERCMCSRHLLKAAERIGFDPIIPYGHYPWQSLSNNYIYSPGGGQCFNALGLYGDLPDVQVDLRIENTPEHVWFHRAFKTPAGVLNDVIQWSRPDMGYGDGPNPHRIEPLVKKLDDLESLRYLYPQPREDMLADIPLLLEEVGARGLVVTMDCAHVGSWGMEVFLPQETLMYSVTDPELLRGVCRLAQDAHLRNLRAMLERGIPAVYDSWFQCGPSVGWSPHTYCEFFLPLIKEAIALAHHYNALYIYQDDGKMKDIIPLLVEAGVDVISGLQPPDVGDVNLQEIKKRFGSQVALLGGLDPCYTFDMGTPEIVRAAVRQAIADAGPNGGYMLGTAEAVAPQTPEACLRAAIAACQEFGIY